MACAVDHEGEILESYVTKMHDKSAALAFIKKAFKRHSKAETIMTDGLRSYPATMRNLGNLHRREMGPWKTSGWTIATCNFDDESEQYCGSGG